MKSWKSRKDENGSWQQFDNGKINKIYIMRVIYGSMRSLMLVVSMSGCYTRRNLA